MSTTNNTTIDFTGESSEDDDISSQDERDIIEEIESDVKKREVEDDDDQEGEEDKEQQVNESISLREWVEANIRIAEMNDNLKKLDDLERFVKSKEKDLLRNIIAYSLPHIADKLDMNEESRVVNVCGSNWRSVVDVTANVVLRSVLAVVSRTFIPQTHTIHKSIDTRRIDDQMLMDSVVNQEFSSSDEEKGTEIHGSLVMCTTSAQTQQVPKKQYRKRKKKPTAESTTPKKARSTSVTTNDSKHIDDTSQEQQNPSVITMVIPADQQDVYNSENKKVYRTDQYLDKFHEGPNFYSHIKDITIGGALGIRKAIQIVKSERSSDVIHSMHGIQMTKGSWIHFKDYISNDLRPSTNSIALSSREKIANTFLAQVKALKLLYGVSGYAETLLNDAYPPLYLPESHSVLFSANASEKDRREALENILRDIEQMIVQSKSTTDQQWLSDLSKYYRDHYQSVYNNARMDSPPVTLDDKYWDTLKELVEDIDQHFESYGPIQNRVVPLYTVGNELGPDALEIEKKYKIPKYLRFWDSLLSQDTEYTKMSAINKVFSSVQTRQELMRSMYHKLANIAATPLRALSVMSGRPQVESKRQIQTQEEQPSNEIDEIPASVETLSYQNSYQLNESQWPSAVLTELALGKDPRPILESLRDKDLKVVRAEIQQWNKEIEAKTRLTIAPRILHQLKFHVEGAEKESEGDQLLGSLAGVPNMTTEEWSAHFREQAVKTGKEEYTVSSMNQALFPEVPWEGKDLSVLQLVYLREQLKRSQLPRYTLSASFKDPDQNITKAFWQGIWELPEGLSNFMEVREPPKPVIKVVGPPPPPPPKQQKPAPPPVTPKIPTIPPVIRPVAPIQPIQPVPPPITPVLPPMRPPPLPPVRLAPPPPPPPPPAPPVQPPPPPQRIPGRTPVQVPDSTYRAEVLQDIQRRLFGQQQR